ncbi:hypothetical protein [Acidisphaera sp. S103]|uniref:hypothetical protein n=1 Tax=Acidisphaera sp. S103 TaxID=1747223 RepID=UPI00131C9398|nr:hypothetical protein [Acidisphaera sp. S103]
MEPKTFVVQLNEHLSHLYSFARQINELDFAASLSGEFRGMQDAGWSTTITANEVFDELSILSQKTQPISKAEFRVMLMLYCQLSEAGGFYESLKNIMGVVTLKPYLLWPFKDLVRVKKTSARITGPNANATFRDLASSAKSIGLSRLSFLLEDAFRDDIRNGVSHADYVLWGDELRLRNRNGGHPDKLSIEEINEALTRGMGFFEILRDYNAASMRSFDPAKEIVGRLSANFPMSWTVHCDPQKQMFRISGSSPGPVTSPTYDRQVSINNRLGGKMLATYSTGSSDATQEILDHIGREGFEPNTVVMDSRQLADLVDDIEKLGIWDDRQPGASQGHVLLASPWGFRWLNTPSEFNTILEKPIFEFDMGTTDAVA